MNTSVKLIYEELLRRGITVDVFELNQGKNTMLFFSYRGHEYSIGGVSPDLNSSTGRTIARFKNMSQHLAGILKIVYPSTIEYTDRESALTFLMHNKKVVVKPFNASHGDGITVGILTRQRSSIKLPSVR